ncbi:MAG: lysophospholipid acyltransferase family protein [Aestuariivita sp.]|nr:lysophospholipid acyltransferase family protein [Aestuariivita sp.]
MIPNLWTPFSASTAMPSVDPMTLVFFTRKKQPNRFKKLNELLQYVLFQGLIGGLRFLPYPLRIATFGRITQHVIAPLAGWRSRIKDNLHYIFPDISEQETSRIISKTTNNIGRFCIEIFSPRELKEKASEPIFEGPGLEHINRAKRDGQAVIVVSGHFGNYDILRSGLIDRGFDTGALYRPMNNDSFNRLYERTINKIGNPLFRRDRKGLMSMIRHIRAGNVVAILIDQHMNSGATLTFFGKPASTSVSVAQLALKYDTLLIPAYAIRQENGLDFRVSLEEPILHSTAEEMTQEINDSLENQIRKNIDQWLWIHRRWKDRPPIQPP